MSVLHPWERLGRSSIPTPARAPRTVPGPRTAAGPVGERVARCWAELAPAGWEEGTTMLVSSGGGHFAELWALAGQAGVTRERRHWVVPRTPQTEGRLAGEQVTWVREVASRQLLRAGANLAEALRIHRAVRPVAVVSAGAAQAVPHLVAAAATGCPVVYVESVARLEGPSLTGRLARRLPRATVCRQLSVPGGDAGAPGWEPRWSPVHDVYESFTTVPAPPGGPARDVLAGTGEVLVALGTEHFAFPRAVDQVRALLPGTTTVRWQVGTTDYEVDGVQLDRWLPSRAMDVAFARADVAIVHGGAGSVLAALEAGLVPVVVPRLPDLGEHVDDHQVQMCRWLEQRGLVVVVRPGESLGAEHVRRAAALRAVPAQPAEAAWSVATG